MRLVRVKLVNLVLLIGLAVGLICLHTYMCLIFPHVQDIAISYSAQLSNPNVGLWELATKLALDPVVSQYLICFELFWILFLSCVIGMAYVLFTGNVSGLAVVILSSIVVLCFIVMVVPLWVTFAFNLLTQPTKAQPPDITTLLIAEAAVAIDILLILRTEDLEQVNQQQSTTGQS